MMSTESVTIALLPRDGFFFKDGRGWYTSDTNRAGALAWPFPSTIRGALTTACGFARQERENMRLDAAGWLALKKEVVLSGLLPLRRNLLEQDWLATHRLWPVPGDALHTADGVVPLQPTPRKMGLGGLSLGDGDEAEAIEALWHPVPLLSSSPVGKPLDPPAWWTDEDFTRWLCGLVPASDMADNVKAMRMERRPDIKVVLDQNSLTAKDGGLYAYEVLETLTTRHQWALGVRTTLPNGLTDLTERSMTVGGKGRLTHVEVPSTDIWHFPDSLAKAFAGGARGLKLVLVTPGHFPGGWSLPAFHPASRRFVGKLPGVTGELVMRAAIVPRAITVSGWDLEKGHVKKPRRLVAPGSVYFLHKRDGGLFTATEARALWLSAIGQSKDDGFGLVVPGIWPMDDRQYSTILKDV